MSPIASLRWCCLLLWQGLAFTAAAQYNSSYQQQLRTQQQQSYNRSMEMNRQAFNNQQRLMQQNQQMMQRNQQASALSSTHMHTGMAAMAAAMQMELMQRYAADDTALALIRMFKRKRGSGWPWLVAGSGGGLALMLTSIGKVSKPSTIPNAPPMTSSEINYGQMIGGGVVMMLGSIGYYLTGARYNMERLAEVLIAREQHRPIPVRYLRQLQPRDFNPFAGEVLR